MSNMIPVFLGDVRIGMYTEEETLGIDPQAAVTALRSILFEKTPKATNTTATIGVNGNHSDPDAKVQAVRITAKISVEVETH